MNASDTSVLQNIKLGFIIFLFKSDDNPTSHQKLLVKDWLVFCWQSVDDLYPDLKGKKNSS
jgi:hypothetical protein